jgi:hypothetical protein
MTDVPASDATWTPWRVAGSSGFEVRDGAGEVGLVQIDAERFLVTKAFRFSDDEVEGMLSRHLVDDGMDAEAARRAVDDARTFAPSTENPTDLASIPVFMRWFETAYGRHTLAAILHDNLIVGEPNGGALRSDTLADRFFREMMRAVGVPFFKRWIMWAAVALRTRWAAGGMRRASLALWVVLAVVGIASSASAMGSILFDWGRVVDVWLLVVVALVLPFASSPLWGRQWGASLVAAVAALWILPAAAFAALGVVVYRALELVARTARLR